MDISGAPQTRPIVNSAPNPLGPPIVKIWENYTNDNIHVPISVLLNECWKIYRPSSVKFKDVIVFCYPIFYNWPIIPYGTLYPIGPICDLRRLRPDCA